MDTYIDVKFIFDSVRLGLSSSTDILQKAYVALRVPLRLVNAASPRTISVHKKKISSGTQGTLRVVLLGLQADPTC